MLQVVSTLLGLIQDPLSLSLSLSLCLSLSLSLSLSLTHTRTGTSIRRYARADTRTQTQSWRSSGTLGLSRIEMQSRERSCRTSMSYRTAECLYGKASWRNKKLSDCENNSLSVQRRWVLYREGSRYCVREGTLGGETGG